jgi:hypothetical protein
MQVECGAMNLVGATSSINFTWPTTFRRKYHSSTCNISMTLCMGYIQMAFFLETPVWESQNFERSYFLQIKFVLSMQGKYFITFKNIFPTTYYTA